MGEKLQSEYEVCFIGNTYDDHIKVIKEDGRYFFQVMSGCESFMDSSIIEISRVTYCALLVDTKLAESLL